MALRRADDTGGRFATPSSSQRQLGWLWGGVAALCVLFSPLADRFAGGLGLFCPFKRLTGIPCPACGSTRAALDLARLDVAHAFVHYPLQSAGWTLLVAGGFAALAWTLLGRDLPRLPRRLPAWSVALLATLVLANWGYCIATGV